MHTELLKLIAHRHADPTTPEGAPSAAAWPRRLILLRAEAPPSAEDWAWRRPPSADGVWERALAPLPASAMPPALRPLHAHRGRLIALDGLTPTWPGAAAEPELCPFRLLEPAVSAALARPDARRSLRLGAPSSAAPPSARTLSTAAAWRRLFDLSGRGSLLDQRLSAYASGRLSPQDRLRVDLHLPRITALGPRLGDAAPALIAAAFAMDLTRTVTLSLRRDELTPGGSPAAALSALVAALEATPEGEGSLMDRCLIAWAAFDGPRFPALLLGGQWAYRGGRALSWPAGTARAPGCPHQRMLVSVARAMGLEIEALGGDHLWTDDGVLIDLTGELFELY